MRKLILVFSENTGIFGLETQPIANVGSFFLLFCFVCGKPVKLLSGMYFGWSVPRHQPSLHHSITICLTDTLAYLYTLQYRWRFVAQNIDPCLLKPEWKHSVQ